MTEEAEDHLDESTPGRDVGGWRVVTSSIDKTLKVLWYICTPLVLIRFLQDRTEEVEFIMENPLISLLFLLICAIIFLYFILNNVDIRSLRAMSLKRLRLPSVKKRSWRHPILVTVGVLASFAALTLIVIAYVSVYITGLHWVVVASAANEQLAAQEVSSINEYLNRQGEWELRARAYASTATGSNWYMITIGKYHFTQEEAEKTFEEARDVLGKRMREDAYIYSTATVSPFDQVMLYFRRMFAWGE